MNDHLGNPGWNRFIVDRTLTIAVEFARTENSPARSSKGGQTNNDGANADVVHDLRRNSEVALRKGALHSSTNCPSRPARPSGRTSTMRSMPGTPGAAVVRIAPRQNEPDYVQFIPDEVTYCVPGGPQGRAPGHLTPRYFPAIPAGATVSAINQLADQVDCFYFERAGALRVNWVVGTGTWIGPNALTQPGVGQPGQPMATARQLDNQIDVFFVDNDGVVNVMWVVDGGAWQGPVGLTPPGTAVPNSPIATARQTDHQIDLFFVDGNGVVNVMWVVDGGDLARTGRADAPGTAVPGAPIATARQTEQPDRPLLRRRQRRGQRDVGGRRRRVAGTGRADGPRRRVAQLAAGHRATDRATRSTSSSSTATAWST